MAASAPISPVTAATPDWQIPLCQGGLRDGAQAVSAAFLRGKSQDPSEPKDEVTQLRSPAVSSSQQMCSVPVPVPVPAGA